jgi:hypothetical protein
VCICAGAAFSGADDADEVAGFHPVLDGREEHKRAVIAPQMQLAS